MRPRLRHLRHPVAAVHSLIDRLRLIARRRAVEHQFRGLKRDVRSQCWCGGSLLPFRWHRGYGVCERCGTYVNRKPPMREELRRIYSFESYWHTRQHLKGYPDISGRTANDLVDGRLDYWLTLISRYSRPPGTAVEIGCAHGILLGRLHDLGYHCVGVEPDPETAEWTRNATGLDVRSGLFPDVVMPSCKLFLAFDVLEHSPDPVGFLSEASRILDRGGTAVIQTPIDRYDFQPPFGERFKPAFDDVEHLFLFTDRAMEELAARSHLKIVNRKERLWLHHEICIFSKP